MHAVSTMAGANALGQLLVFASLPLLARWYDKSAFGKHALITSFAGVGTVGACLCLDLAIVSGSDDEDADDLFAAAIMSSVLATVVATVSFTLLVGMGWFGYGQLPWWSVAIAPTMVGLNGLYGAARYRTLRDQRYSGLARATLAQNSGRAIAPIAWHLALSGWAGLSLGELTGRALGVRGLLIPLLPRLRGAAVWGNVRRWWALVRRERRYTAALSSLVLIDSTASLLIAPLLAGAYGADAAGEYFLVATVLFAPAALIGSAIADVMHVRAARLHLDAPGELPRLLHRFAMILFVAACAIYLPVAFLAPWAFPLFLGDRWAHAGQLPQALAPFMIVSFVASPASRLMAAVNRPYLKVWSDALRLIGTPVLISACARAHVPFLTAMWYLSWFLAACYLFYFLLTRYAISIPGIAPELAASGTEA